MPLLIKANVIDEYAEGADYAVWDVDQDDVRKMQKLREEFTQLKERLKDVALLSDLEFWDCAIVWATVKNLPETDFWQDTVDRDDGPWLIEKHHLPTYEEPRLEGERLVLDDHGFYWSAWLKHTSIRVETKKIYWGWWDDNNNKFPELELTTENTGE